eukprot:SAG31_NODE_1459_length_8254_cov_4.297854_5_plen_144_part_00
MRLAESDCFSCGWALGAGLPRHFRCREIDNGLDAPDAHSGGLPERAKVLAAIQGIDHWWQEQRRAMVLGPDAVADDKDAMLARLVAGVPRRARPSTAERELANLQVKPTKTKQEKGEPASKKGKKTSAQRWVLCALLSYVLGE